MKTVILWKTKRNQAEGSLSTGVRYSKHTPKVRGITNLKMYCNLFRKHLTTSAGSLTEMSLTNSLPQKKESALGPDGIPYSVHRCAGGLGSQFLFNAYKYLLEEGTIPEHFAESRTVFIPKTSDIDDNGRIIRSPDALRPLTLCNCDCKLLTTAICRGPPMVHHEMHTSLAEMHLFHTDD